VGVTNLMLPYDMYGCQIKAVEYIIILPAQLP
jgi:hypothetical protein